MKTIQSLILLAALTLVLNADAAWQTDLRTAQAQAQRENKAVLINFTGSDWCGWCVKLKAEVFNQPAFQSFARENLVLVEVDFPRRPGQTPVQKAANTALAARYGIQGYPTIVFLSASGQELGRSGYRPGGPEGYVQEVTRIVGARRVANSGAASFGGAAGSALPEHKTLKLQSITGKKRRLAMLNDTTFSEGESARVRLGNSKVLVQCVEIKEKSVIVAVEGEKSTRQIVWEP